MTRYTDLQLDALRELANIGSGTASTALSSMLGRSVDITVPMSREAGPIFVTMTEMFDVADAFCKAERLLSLARTPRQRALHNWLLGELVHQLDGSGSRPWTGSPRSAAPSRSQWAEQAGRAGTGG